MRLALVLIFFVAATGCERVMSSLARKGAKGGIGQQKPDNDWRDLSFHEIIRSGGKYRIQRIQQLIKEGGDLNEIDFGVTPAMRAVSWGGQYDIAILLLEAGADHAMYQKGSNQRLAHFVERERLQRAAVWSAPQRADHVRLVNKLESMGESFAEVRKDFSRWERLYSGKSLSEAARLREQEIASRKANE